MKRIVMTGFVLFAIVVGPAFAQDAKVQKGVQVYAAQKCSKCHSIAQGQREGKAG